MPNYDLSNLAKAQAKAIQLYNDASLKYRYPSTFLNIIQQTSVSIPDHMELRKREDRPVEISSFARSARALGSARDANHTLGDYGDSLILTPNWETSTDGFPISIKQGDNSIYTYEEKLANELRNMFQNFAEGQEEDAIDFIFSSRSQVNNATTTQGTFDATDNVFTITEATNGNRAKQITKTVMEENNLKMGSYVFFCDSYAYDLFAYQAAQGAGNSENLSFQDGNITFVRSIGLEDSTRFGSLVGSYNKGVWIAVPQGMLGYLPWIPTQNRVGKEFPQQTYANVINPIDNLEYALHYYGERANNEGNNGQTQDHLFQFEGSIDGAFVKPELTTATEEVLQAFALI